MFHSKFLRRMTSAALLAALLPTLVLLSDGCGEQPSANDCTPASCGVLEMECGSWADGCGGILTCGGCQDGYSCTEDGSCQLDGNPCEDHCINGVSDCGEAGIDCGGTCGECYCPNQQVGEVLLAEQYRTVAWTFDNPSFSGNPFDLESRATFTHCNTGATLTTRLFYKGNGQWGVHFTGRAAGRWIFETAAQDSDLHGQVGTVQVAFNGGVDGFHTAFGAKWGWTGSNRAFVPQLAMHPMRVDQWGDPAAVDQLVQTYVRDHGFNGLHVRMASAWYDHNNFDVRSVGQIVNDLDGECPDPDVESFVRLKRLVDAVHAAGGMVHIWQWFDSQRQQTPGYLPGGANGSCDRRLQNYIAAYLGPVPGWSMGYGFDVQEYAGEAGLSEWYDHLNAEMEPYFHPLGARWGDDPTGIGMYYDGFSYAGYQQHRPTYSDYRTGFTTYPDKLQFSEDRFRLRPTCGTRPDKDYTLQMIRRGLWISTLAGGTANIWGVLAKRPEDCDCLAQGFPRPDWTKTWSRFWKWRFLRDLEPCDDLTDGGAHCMKNAANTSFVFYGEDTASLTLDLRAMAGDQPAVAVDTTRPYEEIDLGTLSPGLQTFEAPGAAQSDWAVAIGPFEQARLDPGIPSPPNGLEPGGDEITPNAQGQVTLSWRPVAGCAYRVRLARLVPGSDPEVVVNWTDTPDVHFIVPVSVGENYRFWVRARDLSTQTLSDAAASTFRVYGVDPCRTNRPPMVHDLTTLEAFVRACFVNEMDDRAQQSLPNTDSEHDFQALMRDVRDLLIQTYPVIHYARPEQDNYGVDLDAFALIAQDGNRTVVDYVVDSAAGGVLVDKLDWQAGDGNVCQ